VRSIEEIVGETIESVELARDRIKLVTGRYCLSILNRDDELDVTVMQKGSKKQ